MQNCPRSLEQRNVRNPSRRIAILFGVVICHAFAHSHSVASAASWTERAKLTPPSASGSASFGSSVATQDGIALISAPGDDLDGENWGSASVIDVDPLSLTFGKQLVRFAPTDAQSGASFGGRVAIGEGVGAVGGGYDGENYTFHLHNLDPASGEFGTLLHGVPTSVTSGRISVSMNDSHMIVGTTDADCCGAAYLYDADPASTTFGEELTKFTPSRSATEFGTSVALHNGRAIVGAYGAPPSPGTWNGAGYLFDANPLSSSFGAELAVLEPLDPGSGNFGMASALNEAVAVMGRWYNVHDQSGSAYVFDVNPASATFGMQLLKLQPPEPERERFFGGAVVIEDEVAYITASATVYGFDVNPSSPSFGQELFRLVLSDTSPSPSDSYRALRVSVDGDVAVVGAYWATDRDVSSGAVYIFTRDSDLSGDTNKDGTVDLLDLNNVRNHFGGTGLGDTNADGKVDLVDLNNVRNHFGETSASMSVPEPGALGLAASLLATFAIRIPLRARGR